MANNTVEAKLDFLTENGKIIYPIALIEGIYSLDGTSLKDKLENMNKILYATFAADGWTEENSVYTQTVSVEGIKESDTPTLIKAPLSSDATVADVKAYDKAYSILASPIDAYTGDGNITFKVIKKPAISITVGLKGVM